MQSTYLKTTLPKYALSLMLLILISFSSLLPANNYKRIISLDICSDWMLISYADRSQILALSPLLNDYPVEWVKGDWPTHDGSLEQILELDPDLVITGEFNVLTLRTRLIELGKNVEILTLPKSLNSLKNTMQQFLNLVGSTEEVPDLPGLIELEADAPRLLLLGANGIGTGTDTLEHEILLRAGWRNYLSESGYGKLDLEQLIVDPPDAVSWSAPASAALANMFSEHSAFKKLMQDKMSQNMAYGQWQCSGPWTWQQIQQLTTLREQWQKK